MTKITAIVLTYNEQQHISRCIKSLLNITNEIFIIDSHSNDDTVKLAEDLGATVYSNSWPGNHALQLKWAFDNCNIKTDWIIRLDADEYLTPKLINEINGKLPTLPENETGIYLKRRVIFQDMWIKHGGYYPTWLLRIWRNNCGIVEQRWMDEHIKLTKGESVQFDNDFIDHNLNNLTWWTEKHNNYSTREAIDLLNTIFQFKSYDEVIPKFLGTQEQRKRWLKVKYASMPLFLRPFLYFLYRYFIKLGFLDRRQGLIWHFLQGFWYRFLVDAKIYEIYSKTGKNKAQILQYLKAKHGIEL